MGSTICPHNTNVCRAINIFAHLKRINFKFDHFTNFKALFQVRWIDQSPYWSMSKVEKTEEVSIRLKVFIHDYEKVLFRFM